MSIVADTSKQPEHPARPVRCRYLPGGGDDQQRCAAPAADPAAEVLLCSEHLAAAVRVVDAHRAQAIARLRRAGGGR